MPADPPEMPDAIDPDDPAEQGFWGARDQPGAQDTRETQPPRSRRPSIRDPDEDERHSER